MITAILPRRLIRITTPIWIMVSLLTAIAVGCGSTTSPAASPSTSAKPSTAASTSPSTSASTSPAASAKVAPTNTPVPKVEKVKWGYGSLAATHFWAQLALDQGLFKENALDPELLFMGGGTQAVQALIAGELDFIQGGSTEAIQAAIAGADLKVIASGSPYMNFLLVVNDKVKTTEDLKGKKVGISKFGSSSHTAVRIMLDKVGVDPEKDVQVLQVGDDRTRLGAMAGGAIDATVITLPGLQAKPFGFKGLIDASELKIKAGEGVIIASGKVLKERPDVVRRFIKTYVDAIHFAKTNRKASEASMRKFYKTDDDETVQANLDYFNKLVPNVPLVDPEGVQNSLDEASEKNPDLKGVNTQAHIDNRWVEELDKSGYIKKLYGQ